MLTLEVGNEAITLYTRKQKKERYIQRAVPECLVKPVRQISVCLEFTHLRPTHPARQQNHIQSQNRSSDRLSGYPRRVSGGEQKQGWICQTRVGRAKGSVWRVLSVMTIQNRGWRTRDPVEARLGWEDGNWSPFVMVVAEREFERSHAHKMSVPPHTLQESPNCRAINISDWVITASTNPISNAPECDALHARLGFPLPEMTFGNNFLTLLHRPSGKAFAFTTAEALRGVKNGQLEDGDGGVKVNYAEKWMQSRYDFNFFFFFILRTWSNLSPE